MKTISNKQFVLAFFFVSIAQFFVTGKLRKKNYAYIILLCFLTEKNQQIID
jgi:hypothetical protein